MQNKEKESSLKVTHTLHFKLNDNTKKLLQLLNSITEEKQEFTVEKFIEMTDKAKGINLLSRYANEMISVFLDDNNI